MPYSRGIIKELESKSAYITNRTIESKHKISLPSNRKESTKDTSDLHKAGRSRNVANKMYIACNVPLATQKNEHKAIEF